ncbi:uncharacterized protein LY89DRAFT_370709 [Mollisia scopiformis]|uniref:WW domain-containing protein n=1 Tax=Mollisia scopiformis TaxID=149040 RepID=A0A132B681_MOLSC|nr:uncharacterized protein LY89DRAFT_370709 [Mollisia scopiformis]KUJ07177.1 hypothetical protein LY89DRAFT_370709 [Mollisia scopiformis]
MDVDNLTLAREERASAWALAKARSIDDLEPSERQLYDNATLENIYYSTSNTVRSDGENSKTRNVIRKLGPLVSAIQSYGTAMDAFSQIAPLYLSPIWGSIRVLLVAADAHKKFYSKIVDVLERVGDILPRFRDYERIYHPQKHPRLTQAISNAYLDIITLCTNFRQTIRDHQASKVRRIFKPLSNNLQSDEAIEKFRQHRQNVEDEANLCHMIEASEERETRMTLFAVERRRRLLARLSNVDCTRKHCKLKNTRHKGTGIWLPQHPEYIKWESNPKSAVLCCHGIPGCGKSVLASTIIDSTEDNKRAIFYYCDYADKRTLFPSNVFGTLARQILERQETLPEPLAPTIERAEHDGDRLTDHSEAFRLLVQCIEIATHPLCIVLDGLDECTEHSQKIICDGLQHLLHLDNLKLKVFITARAELESSLKLRPSISSLSISISSATIALDIGSYVRASTRHRISNGSLVMQDPSLEELIVDKLVNGAKGMFLWVEFQLNDLCDAESDCGIKNVLENLPRSLSETYDRLLSRIEGRDRATMIERMFKWLVCARQPLRVEELREGVAFTIDDLEWDQDKIVTDLNRLVRACSNLVVIDVETQIVQLSHYTVEQYLLQNDAAAFHFTREDAEIMAGEFCLAYLSFSNFETKVTPYRENTNTNLVALGRIAQNRLLVSPYHPGQAAIRAWNSIRKSDVSPIDFDMTEYTRKRPVIHKTSEFSCLQYVIDNWLVHTGPVLQQGVDQDNRSHRINQLFRDLVLHKELPFEFRPWAGHLPIDDTRVPKALFGWGLMKNHSSLIQLAQNILSSQPPPSQWYPWYDDSILGWRSFYRHNCFDESRYKHPNADCLEDSYVLETPSPSWIFSKLLAACRKGHIEAVKSSGIMDMAAAYDMSSDRSQLLHYSIVVVAMNGHLPVLEYFLPLSVASRTSTKIMHAGSGYFLNALEYGILSGHLEIVRVHSLRGRRLSCLLITIASTL